MDSVRITVTKEYWTKYHTTPEGILKLWDEPQEGFVHFKIPNKPDNTFRYVIVNIGGKLRGYFEVSSVKELNVEYLESVGLENDFEAGWFVVCYWDSWIRLLKEPIMVANRGFNYDSLSRYL